MQLKPLMHPFGEDRWLLRRGFERYNSYGGSISTPLIVCWPDGIKAKKNGMTSAPGYRIDVMPAFLEITSATYPKEHKGEWSVRSKAKASFRLRNRNLCAGKLHVSRNENKRAIRYGDWKAVFLEHSNTREVYNLANDRAEQHKLAAAEPEIPSVSRQVWYDRAVTHQIYPKGRITH
jgi:arylsulfatase